MVSDGATTEEASSFEQGGPIEVVQTAPDSARALDAPRPERLGRYIVVEAIGAGGMGQVYRAFDPQLERMVAIKLMLPSADDDAHERLLREAQAMAKLSHPHVVPVFDVGTVDDRVFVAMDLVEGQTLGRWMRQERRPWREVVQVFVQAGRGLAAAHDAGLIHRDFKPDNVLVGRLPQGTPWAQVLDFGLAKNVAPDRLEGLAETEDGPRASAPDRVDPSWTGGASMVATLTRTGAVMGTPAYMSPEQILGEPLDARSDQFSFCVALYEALTGERPFAGDSRQALAINVLEGKRRPAPSETAVPKRLLRVCLKGVERQPSDRHTSMDELLDALESLTARRRARIVLGAGVLVGVGAVAVGLGLRPSATVAPCQGAAARLEGIWDASRRQQLEALTEAEPAHLHSASMGAAALLDAYADQWAATHTEACEATQVHGTQSPALLDRRMGCLDARRQQLEAAVDVLIPGSPSVWNRAVEVAAGLPSLAYCSDAEALRAEVPLPEDPSVREQVEQVEQELAQARALLDAGTQSAQVAPLEALREQVEAMGWMPAQIDVSAVLGRAYSLNSDLDAAQQQLEFCVFGAIETGHRVPGIWCAERLAYVVGYRNVDAEGGRQWARLARSIAGPKPSAKVEVLLLRTRGLIEFAAGRFSEARAVLLEALELQIASRGPGKLDEGRVRNVLGAVFLREGDYAAAHEHFTVALEIHQAHYGPRHPALARPLNNLALARERQGRHADAVQYLERGHRIMADALGPDDAQVGLMHQNLGGMLHLAGDDDAARRHLDKARSIMEEALGVEHQELAATWSFLGDVAQSQGQLDEAQRSYQRSHDIRVAAMGSEHTSLLIPLTGLGEVAAAQGDPERAADALQRALLVIGDQKVDPGDEARARFALARVRWMQGRADEARREAEAADARFEAAGLNSAKPREALRRWRAKVGLD